MKYTNDRILGAAGAMAAALGTLTLLPGVAAADAVADGKKIAFDRSQGNCIACHMMMGGDSPGNIGPPLVAMQVRFPDKDKLRAQIWDATVTNPLSPMPPFGSHQILSDDQIDKLVEFIWTL